MLALRSLIQNFGIALKLLSPLVKLTILVEELQQENYNETKNWIDVDSFYLIFFFQIKLFYFV